MNSPIQESKGSSFPFKKVARILLIQDREARLDLFTYFPRLKKFFRERRLHAAVRTAGDIVFAFIIFSGLFGPQEPERNVALFLAWGLWWPTVVFSWFFVGRMWCGFCPFPGLGRLLQRLGLSFRRPVPQWLRKYGVYWAVILLGLIIWIEESTGMKESPQATAYLLAILSGATVSAIIFPKQAWWRHLCPMGHISGVAATLALTEFRPDHDKCRGCKTFACKRGQDADSGCPIYLGAFNCRTNLDCHVCGHCIKTCSYNSPRFNLRSPFTELITNKGRYITCTYIIPFLIGSQLARLLVEGPFYPYDICGISSLCHMGVFSLLLVMGLGYAFLMTRLGARLFGITEDELFGRFSPMVPIFLPLAFSGELLIRLDFAMLTAPEFFPTLGRQFGWDLGAWTFSLPPELPFATGVFLIAFGALAGTYVLRRLVTGDFKSLVSPCSLLDHARAYRHDTRELSGAARTFSLKSVQGGGRRVGGSPTAYAPLSRTDPSKGIEHGLHVCRYRRLTPHFLACHWMCKDQTRCVQHLSRSGRFPFSNRSRSAVQGVAQNRMANRCEMYPDLVCPACKDAKREVGRMAQPLQDPPLGECRFSMLAAHGHPLAVNRVATDRPFNAPSVLPQSPPCEGQIGLAHTSFLELRCQGLVRDVVFGDKEEPGGIFVQPVDDAWSDMSADPGEILTMVEKSVNKGAAIVPCSRMYDEARRLVEDQEVTILVHNVEGEGRGLQRKGTRCGNMHQDLVSGPKSKAGGNTPFATHLHVSGIDKALNL